MEGIRACVFDAYGTLFDVNAAARHCADRIGDAWQPLAETWRAKQLQYTWLRALTGQHADFWQVTQDALDYALASLSIDDPDLRTELAELYLRLDAYPEVPRMLAELKAYLARSGCHSARQRHDCGYVFGQAGRTGPCVHFVCAAPASLHTGAVVRYTAARPPFRQAAHSAGGRSSIGPAPAVWLRIQNALSPRAGAVRDRRTGAAAGGG